ncbi:hypothetical protein GEV33_005224 [Tenebrio molitor]|uniref:Uncharacterized protein n=1 Tax=Tenebrio molitor TaxID=7067 RepID=A0A8J6LF19_TENMO|nr:hypothetical protein GEV33_005224 [Tenebrio molitor]
MDREFGCIFTVTTLGPRKVGDLNARRSILKIGQFGTIKSRWTAAHDHFLRILPIRRHAQTHTFLTHFPADRDASVSTTPTTGSALFVGGKEGGGCVSLWPPAAAATDYANGTDLPQEISTLGTGGGDGTG